MAGGRGRPEHAASVVARLHFDQTVASSHPRHCWVVDPPDRPGRWPALLLEWSREGSADRAAAWRGWVIFAVDLASRRELVETWLEAHYLQPLEGCPAHQWTQAQD